MLYAAKVARQLETSLERFRELAASEQSTVRAFERAIAVLESLDAGEIARRLGAVGRAGALPSEEWSTGSSLVVPFGTQFENHRAAREWALRHIAGIRTLAVDGSEIKPTKDYSLPIAAVQVAWFENPHVATERYVKDVAFEIIHPDELVQNQADGFGVVDQLLALRRFEAEVDKLVDRMRALAARGVARDRVLAFFDGSLVVSFAGQMIETIGADYIDGMCRLIEVSAQTRIPVVGFVDTSLAKDLATMLAVLGDLPMPERVPDSRILDPRMAWGDRTRALVCARDDVLGRYLGESGVSYARELAFVYLKTNGTASPARLDVPRWVVRDGLLDHVVDVVRAEVIVGNGYPYGIEAADACAVLGAGDREHFYRLVQDFAIKNGIGLRVVPKAASKRRRRAM
jgi:hypothetical protein